MNDISTMNKIVEYMAVGRPIVQFDTREGRISAKSRRSTQLRMTRDRSRTQSVASSMTPSSERRWARVAESASNDDLAWSRQVPQLIAAYSRALSKGRLDINLRRAGWWRKPAVKSGRNAVAAPVSFRDTTHSSQQVPNR